MNIFNLFKKKVKLNDDTFGVLNYTTFKDASRNFYDGQVYFQEALIGITIDADQNGPTNAQKDFYKKLSTDYHEIKDTIIIPFLKGVLEDNIEEAGLNNFDQEFDIDGISIGRAQNEEYEWSITYDSNPMRHYVTIELEGMEPKYMTMDG